MDFTIQSRQFAKANQISHLAMAHKKAAAAPRMNSDMFQAECEEKLATDKHRFPPMRSDRR